MCIMLYVIIFPSIFRILLYFFCLFLAFSMFPVLILFVILLPICTIAVQFKIVHNRPVKDNAV